MALARRAGRRRRALLSARAGQRAAGERATKLTAQQLENRILGSQRMSFSGYAESNATFGLPPLPAFSSVTPLLDGVTRMRVWQASPDHWRVDTLSDAGENDTYQAGCQRLHLGLRRAAAHRDLRAAGRPAAQGGRPRAVGPGRPDHQRGGTGSQARPAAAAARRRARARPGWRSRRPARSPRSRGPTSGPRPATGLPLLVEVFSRGSAQPALETQFLQVGPVDTRRQRADAAARPGHRVHHHHARRLRRRAEEPGRRGASRQPRRVRAAAVARSRRSACTAAG